LKTDELEPFEVKAIIAADGVNSELAELSGARPKFTPEDLYQGVKVVVKLPEEILQERFNIKPNEGAAHLFAGDVTLDHIGGGFLYTNRDTLSLGAVYHYDSLMENPVEPYVLVDRLLKNPLISEFVKDEVAIKEDIDKSISTQEQLRARFAVSKLLKNWGDLRDQYYSQLGRARIIEKRKIQIRRGDQSQA